MSNFEKIKSEISQYFEMGVKSYGAFNINDSDVKKSYVNTVLNNNIEKEVFDIARRLLNKMKEANILDMGCGLGGFLSVCKENKINAFGIDIDTRALEIARLRNDHDQRIILGNCENLPFATKSFDLIASLMVIEHIQDPILYLEEAFRVLKENGKLIIFAPNYLFPWEGHYKFFWLPFILPYTKWVFKAFLKLKSKETDLVDFINFKITPKYLGNMLRQTGFSEIQDMSLRRFKERIDNPELINNPKPNTLLIKIKKHKILYSATKRILSLLSVYKIYHPIILIVKK